MPGPLFGRGGPAETLRIGELLRTETVGGILLLTAAVAAIGWANWPGTDSYSTFLHATLDPGVLHLHLSAAAWAGDGLLATFLASGLEVEREFVAGDLRTPRRATLPVLAAVGGMVVPAAVFTAVNLGSGDGALRGWAIPSATDIAFALALITAFGVLVQRQVRTWWLLLPLAAVA